MGAGIAQLAAAAGARTLLHDPVDEARERGLAQIADGLERWRAKGRLEREPGEVAAVEELGGPGAGCGLVIEAAPERLELKRELFAALSEIAPGAVLASNTSSIPITAIAGAAADPGRVVGMHFFNPRARDAPRRGHRRHRLLARGARRRAGDRAGDGQGGHRRRPTAPASWSTAATGPSASRRCKLLQERVADVETDRRDRARRRAFGWGPSSSRTSSGSTSATRSRSPSTSSASASRAGDPRR